ncbi:MAG: B12-binding domain-containing radical SAM protein [Bacteroidetes bacterium]|nr:B12-binding domain-containing radical SAM protein [Bacteroidota bacterium]
MKICIIRPAVIHREVAFSHMPSAPLGPAYIAAMLRADGHEVQAIDAAVEGFHDVEKFQTDKLGFDTYVFGLNIERTISRIDPHTDVICFSFMYTNNWYYDQELLIAARQRFPHAVFIAGGEHVTAAPDFCLDTAPELDYIVLGEGESTISELVSSLAQNEPVDGILRLAYRKEQQPVVNNNERRIKRVQQVNDIPWPAWDLFPLEKYFQYKVSYGVYRGNSLPVMASRGCPYDCTFCSSPQMWGKKYSLRDVKDFVDEMEYYYKKYNVVSFDFFDLTAIIYKDWIVKLCDEIMRRDMQITYQIPAGTRAEAIDHEVAQKLYQSGCKNITYAPESGSPRVLKAIKKRVKLPDMLESIRHSYRVGMNIKLNIIVGFPDETHLDVWKTLWFLVQSSWYGAHDMYPGVFSPYPGSALYDRLAQEGRVDLYDGKYMMAIVSSHDLWPGDTYNDKMSPTAVKIYSILMFVFFYGSNFLFRPTRFYKLVRNLVTRQYESRAESVLAQTFTKLRLSKHGSAPLKESQPLTG